MGSLVDSFFNAEILARALPAVTAGLWVTLQLTLAIIPTGITLGLALALVRVRRLRPLNILIVIFVDVFRAVPPLVILIVLYFALPYLDIRLSGFTAAWLGLSLVLAAFSEEIFWAGILSVDEGQWEAARATGLSSSATLVYVVLPQAVRLAIAPLTNRAIAIGKGTALASVIAVPEILNQATSIQAQTANPSPLTLAAMAYLVLFLPLVVASRWVESRFGWRH
ncbi:MAG: amino acid ABC transporter permease [Acidobacteria bacterium]|nr:MAG: amino acid ABC transporter permease [Acidobacteriota bacterium]